MNTKTYKTNADNGFTGTLEEVFEAVVNYGEHFDLESNDWDIEAQAEEKKLNTWAETDYVGATYLIGEDWIERIK